MMHGFGPGGYSSRALPLVYTRMTAPAGEVVDVDRACRHLRLDAVDLDDVEKGLVQAAIAAAHQELDGRTGILGRALLTQTWQAVTDRPDYGVLGARSTFGVHTAPGFLLELPPIQAVTMVERLVSGVYVAVPAASWRALPRPGGRVAVTSANWPASDNDPAAWRMTFLAGYGAAADVPAPIVSAMLLRIADLFDNRDGKVTANMVENPTIDRLLACYRAVGV